MERTQRDSHVSETLDLDDLVTFRRDLHGYPELGFEEHETAARIQRRLRTLGVPFTGGLAKTGIVATIEGARPGPRRIGFRAELDALPMEEANTFAHRSTRPGVKHGCGHDGHSAILLGLAERLKRNNDFEGMVHLVFQPAEEGLGGGRAMIEKGLFDHFPMDEIYAIHNWPALPFGEIGLVDGNVMAAAHILRFTVSGIGGHGGMPHETTDQLGITVQILNALNHYCARRVKPGNAVVISMTKVTAGTALTVVPDSVSAEGVVRLNDESERERLYREIPALIGGIAEAFGASASVELEEVYPVTRNHPRQTRLAEEAARRAGLSVRTSGMGLTGSMASEDFAFMLNKVPGCYIWLGQDGPGLHHPEYDFDDRVLGLGIDLFEQIARPPTEPFSEQQGESNDDPR